MKLEKILDNVNSLEKNSFLKIIDNIKSCNPKNSKEIDKILSDGSFDLKSVDSINIAKVFNLVKDEFALTIKSEFVNTTSQLDILIDILIRDGNCILKREWFAKLYELELKKIISKAKEMQAQMESDKSDFEDCRKRDYLIYRSCVNTAYSNDEANNRDAKITDDELSILITLTKQLELSQEEVKLLNYMTIPPEKQDIDTVVNFLKTIGVIFYSKKVNTVFIADEMVRVLRRIREKEIADKYYRRILKTLKESQINLICRKHNINTRDVDFETKIKLLINEGISLYNLLINDLHKEGINLTEKKKFINNLWDNGLKINSPLRGVTVEEKIENIINYFEELERDEKVGISIEGFEKLLIELSESLKSFRQIVLREFQMPEDLVLNSSNLLDYNIKPRDTLDILPADLLKDFIAEKELKSRGDLVLNILDAYKDSENLLIENYEAIGFRNLNELKDNGIRIKESELGLKFEELTQTIFEQLGLNVDEKLKNQLDNSKNKIDLILNLGDSNIIIIECKTVKESGFNKFSSVSRQIKSYVDLAKNKGFNVVKSLLVAPEFSDEFVNECDLEFEINLSLITAKTLINVLEAFRNSKHKQFPYQLLLKDVLINEDRIIKAMKK
ncbi:hypothetical protein ACE1ET_00680 [Saccharicrinis sp. FJH62]|uniref:hypothetical protein n=1 Tax=Saccharicrinis sp. FJH62 TaxID=3344657 RepID=UPI0035D521BF